MSKRTFAPRTFKSRTFKSRTWAGGSTPVTSPYVGNFTRFNSVDQLTQDFFPGRITRTRYDSKVKFVDLTPWSLFLDSDDYYFAQAFNNMPVLDFITLLYDNSLYSGAHASAAALYTAVETLVTDLDSRLVFDDLRPRMILQIMMLAPGTSYTDKAGSMLSENAVNGTILSMLSQIEDIYKTTPSELLTTATLTAIIAAEYTTKTDVAFENYMYMWDYIVDTHATTGNDRLTNANARLLDHGETQYPLLASFTEPSIGWSAIYDNDNGEMFHCGDPKGLKDKLDAYPTGQRVVLSRAGFVPVPYQEITITTSSAYAGTFDLTFGANTTNSITLAQSTRSTVARTSPQGVIASAAQLRHDLRTELDGLASTPQVQVFWESGEYDDSNTATIVFKIYFSDSAKTQDVWPYIHSTVAGPYATVAEGFGFLNGGAGASTITRNDPGGSFVTDGWITTSGLLVENAEDVANDGYYLVTGVTATVLTLSQTEVKNTFTDTSVVRRENSVTTNTDDNTATLRNSGFTVPHYPTAEASYETKMTTTRDGAAIAAGVTITIALKADMDTASGSANLTGSGDNRWADLLDDVDGTNLSGERDIDHPKMTNQATHYKAYWGPWWQEYYDQGGNLDFLLSNHERDANQMQFIDSDTASEGLVKYKAGSSSVQGAQVRTEYYKEVSNETYWTDTFGKWLSTDSISDYQDGTHYKFNDITHGADGWIETRREGVIGRVDESNLLNSIHYEAAVTYFPDVQSTNRRHFISHGVNNLEAASNHGMWSSHGTHGTALAYGKHLWQHDVADNIYSMPDKSLDSNFFPASQVCIKTLDRDTNGEVTVVCFTNTEIIADLYRGTNQGFNGFKVGNWIEIRDGGGTINSGWNDAPFVKVPPTKYQVTAIETMVEGAYTVLKYNDGVTSDVQASGTLEADQLGWYVYVQHMTGWMHMISGVRSSRSLLRSSNQSIAYRIMSPITSGTDPDTPLQTTDAHYWYEIESLYHYALNGAKWGTAYTPGMAPANAQETVSNNFQDLFNDALVELDAVLGISNYTPLTLNMDDEGFKKDYLVSGVARPDGSRLFRVTLQDHDPGVAAALYGYEPALLATNSDSIDFLTRSGVIIRVPGAILDTTSDPTETFANPLGFWVETETYSKFRIPRSRTTTNRDVLNYAPETGRTTTTHSTYFSDPPVFIVFQGQVLNANTGIDLPPVYTDVYRTHSTYFSDPPQFIVFHGQLVNSVLLDLPPYSGTAEQSYLYNFVIAVDTSIVFQGQYISSGLRDLPPEIGRVTTTHSTYFSDAPVFIIFQGQALNANHINLPPDSGKTTRVPGGQHSIVIGGGPPGPVGERICSTIFAGMFKNFDIEL